MHIEDIDNTLEHWDLFRNGNSLYTGKSWPHTLQGRIATFFDYNKSYWGVRGLDDFEVSHNTGKPIIEWYNTYTEVDADNFIEYMDLFRDMVTHLNIVNHIMQLGIKLKKV